MTERITKLLSEEIAPFFGVPEALLSDRGTNLLSHLMLDVCKSLRITKLNTTTYHPECDAMVERFNCTLKAMLRKWAAQYGMQWDKHLPGILWAYRSNPTALRVKSHPFSCLGGTVNLQMRLLCYLWTDSAQLTAIADRLLSIASLVLKRSIRSSMIARRTHSSTVLETGYSYATPVMKQEDSESYQDHGTDLTESLHVMTQVRQPPKFTSLEKIPLKCTRRSRVKPCQDRLLASYYQGFF